MKKIKRLVSVLIMFCMAVSLLPHTAFAAGENSTEGTFTAVCMNVDGLPNTIPGISINSDGPGSEGTKKISAKMAEYDWDIIGVSEDFNYNTELLSSLTEYKSGTHRGGVSGLRNDTDGLNLIWKNTISVTGENWTSWKDHYSTGIFGTGNGADGMIDKGYRYYQAALAEGVAVDVYILHMDADSDAGDIAARESQLTQLANAINASDNKNPIIVMGDTNCRYTRENLKSLFIDAINADSRFTVEDAWIEKVRDGQYPTYGGDAIVAKDKGGTYDYPDAEIVDKLFYINNTDSDVTLTANSYTIATDFTDTNGTALADHWPVVVDFTYTVSGSAHEHNYVEAVTKAASCTEPGLMTYTCSCGDNYTSEISALGHKYVKTEEKAASCTENGYITYICSRCDDSNTEDISALGHQYKNGFCSQCGEADPDAVTPSENPVLGEKTTEVTSGKKYALVFQSTSAAYTLTHDETGALASKTFRMTSGDGVKDELIWTVSEQGDGYVITADINGETMYLARTKTLTSGGYKIALQKNPFIWSMKLDSDKESLRFYTKIIRSDYYLRYYTAKQGWIVTTRGAGIKLYEINE